MTYTFKDFDIGSALNGFPVGRKLVISEVEVPYLLFNFKLSTKTSLKERYQAEDVLTNTISYYDQWGKCSDGDESHNLYLLEGSIDTIYDENIQNSILSRGYIYMSNMRARDYFALAAMQELLRATPNLLGIQNYQIINISTIAYKIAQQMIATGANFRYNPEGEEISERSLETNIEKMLYGISQAINTDGVKVLTVPESEMKIKEMPDLTVNIAEGLDLSNINVTLSNDPLNVNITNEVKITGNITTSSTEPTANLNYLG